MGERRPTHRAIAEHLGLADHKSIREYRDRGMPIHDLAAAKDWYQREIVGEASSDDEAGAGERKLAAEARIKEAKAARDELLLRKLRGELVDRDAAARWVSKAFARVRARIESFPDELVASLPPDVRSSVSSEMREAIRLALVEMGEWNGEV